MKQKLLRFGLFLFFVLAPPSARPEDEKLIAEIATFKVKVVIDSHYQTARTKRSDELKLPNDKEWHQDLDDLIAGLNKNFLKQGINVRLEIGEVSDWAIDEKLDLVRPALDDLMAKVSKDDFDLVIGITGKDFPAETQAAGYYANPGYIVLRDCAILFPENGKIVSNNKWTLICLEHEIGHFFGLHHSDNPDSIMYGKSHIWSSTCRFTAEEIAVINKNAPEAKKQHSGMYR